MLIARLLEELGSADRVLGASGRELQRIRGIGSVKREAILRAMRDSDDLASRELDACERLGVTLVTRGSAQYPPLLEEIRDAPPMLYVRGNLDATGVDRYPVAIVGSRACTSYGVEQGERFGGVLASSGLTVVSGGARGIDSASHRGAMRAGGRTISVLGCGLASWYPPDNAKLFEAIIDGRGAVVSELPLHTPPSAENFPSRNRIISGLSLGVVVIEAARGSGSLITARVASEEHGREVMAVPGRVDSPASEGTNDLIRAGGAALVCAPGDVLAILETPARHSFVGTHEARYSDPARVEPDDDSGEKETEPEAMEPGGPPHDDGPAGRILEALSMPRTVDELARLAGVDPGALRASLTMLEIQGRVRRSGTRVERVR